jgi:hypothetical protein
MIDKRTEILLDAINRSCQKGSYQVIEKSSLINSFPAKLRPDPEGLADMVSYLCDREYIRCKYSDENVFCLAPLPKGRLYHENAQSEQKNKFSYKRLVIAAFLGSVLGGALGAALHALILRFFG